MVALLFTSCKSNKRTNQIHKNNDTKIIQLNPQLNTTLNYSQFVDSIIYIPLETPENVLLGGNVFKIIFAGDVYFVFDENKVFAFDSLGQYLYSMGTKGRAPGELIWPTDFIVDCKNKTVEILSIGNFKIARFDISTGNFIDEFNNKFSAENFWKKNDTTYIFYTDAVTSINKNEINNLVFFDKNKELITHVSLPNPYFLARFNGNSNNSFSSVNDGIIFTRQLDNNIYLIRDNSKIEIKYKIDYGKYNLPINEDFLKRFKYIGDIDDTDYAYHFSGHYCNDSYLFFNFFFQNTTFSTFYDVNNDIVVYGNRINNDIDLGPISSIVGIHSNYLIGTIEPTRFIKHFKRLKKKMSTNKWNEYLISHPSIAKILDSVNPEDNQILALCFLKGSFSSDG